ncbi:hypothetical protein FJU11_18170 [Pararhizobium mangrovi]|uniref:Recombinase domain-containing protein n=1 Tax=Pararhizobium mangrovi TaxID=2590452 RepID=A0A506TX48_9HYPH|nr:hypothetical protein FJU11_18170 [Pararhizobium mangrovi]
MAYFLTALHILADLTAKTHRGLAARACEGQSASGRSYGYTILPRMNERGERMAGERQIDPTEAATIQRIFDLYAEGYSGKIITTRLNAEGVPAPSGGEWSHRTIDGNRVQRRRHPQQRALCRTPGVEPARIPQGSGQRPAHLPFAAACRMDRFGGRGSADRHRRAMGCRKGAAGEAGSPARPGRREFAEGSAAELPAFRPRSMRVVRGWGRHGVDEPDRLQPSPPQGNLPQPADDRARTAGSLRPCRPRRAAPEAGTCRSLLGGGEAFRPRATGRQRRGDPRPQAGAARRDEAHR